MRQAIASTALGIALSALVAPLPGLGGVIVGRHAAPPWTSAAKETVLYSFTGSPDGRYPRARLMRDGAGNLWGTTVDGGGPCDCGTIFELMPQGQSFTESVVYAFGAPAAGEYPDARLYLDKAGTFFGVTHAGGYWNQGALFEMSPLPSGGYSVTPVHEFTGVGDGSDPVTPVIGDSSGTLYGTTPTGGLGNCACGTVFAVSPGQGETVLYSFSGGSDGSTPEAPLVMDSSGVLYGTTAEGGTVTSACTLGCGTVFEIAAGHFTSLYHFKGGTDGAEPMGGLMVDKNGVLYGTTRRGGTGCNGAGCGTVFALAPHGSGYTESVLYGFAARDDGAQPTSDLVMDKSGVLYGTTSKSHGLAACDCGTVFALAKSGSAYQETILHAFTGAPPDGSQPYAGLVLYQPANILYGTTYTGGSAKSGTVFKIQL
jgi:uncharacterized repeat protein (TIGR03803 family)